MAGSFIQGNFLKSLRDKILLGTTARILTGTDDPTSVAQTGEQGSLYLRVGASGGTLFVKQDAGSTTNWTVLGTTSAPSLQIFTSGSGTYTKPADVDWIRIKIAGGGGGGGGSGTSPAAATAGGNTTFGTAFLTANGGGLGPITAFCCGVGGTASGGDLNIDGGTGGAGGGAGGGVPLHGGAGGGSHLGHGGRLAFFTAAGQPGIGFGAGGSGGGSTGTTNGAGGGGGGAYVEKIETSPSATFSFAVGAAGTAGGAGSGGKAGGAGAVGIIIVEEFRL